MCESTTSSVMMLLTPLFIYDDKQIMFFSPDTNSPATWTVASSLSQK